MMEAGRKRDLIIAGILSTPLILCLVYWILLKITPGAWAFKNLTTPLTEERVAYLCQFLNVNETENLCNPPQAVYLIDFFPVIENALLEGKSVFTKAVLDVSWEDFEISCAVRNELDVCLYDLHGDNKFRIVIEFDNVGAIRNVSLPFDPLP